MFWSSGETQNKEEPPKDPPKELENANPVKKVIKKPDPVYIFKPNQKLQPHESLDSCHKQLNAKIKKQEIESKKLEDKFQFVDWKKNEEQIKLSIDEKKRKEEHERLVSNVQWYKIEKEKFIMCNSTADLLLKTLYKNKTKEKFEESFPKDTFQPQTCSKIYTKRLVGKPFKLSFDRRYRSSYRKDDGNIKLTGKFNTNIKMFNIEMEY